MATPQSDTLINGLTFVHLPSPGALFHVELCVRYGMDNETEPVLRESAHALEHMCAKFTSDRHPQSVLNSVLLDSLGVRKNAFTTPTCTGYHATGLVSALETTLDIMLPTFYQFRMDTSVFASEMDAVRNELRNYIGDTWYNFETIVDEVVHRGTARATSTQARLDNVDNLTPESLMAIYDAQYVAPNITCIYAGPSQHVQGLRSRLSLLRGASLQHPPLASPDPPLGTVVRVPLQLSNHLAKVHLCFALRAPYSLVLKAQANCMAMLLTHGFSSRLYRSLRTERGLVYAVSAAGDLCGTVPRCNFFHIAAKCTADRVAEVMQVIEAELARLRREPPATCEMRKWRNQRRTSYAYNGFAAPDDVVDELNWYVHHAVALPSQPALLNAALKVSASDMQRFAQAHLAPASCVAFHNGVEADTVPRMLSDA
jgi:predicted Zn-dependent peptidase